MSRFVILFGAAIVVDICVARTAALTIWSAIAIFGKEAAQLNRMVDGSFNMTVFAPLIPSGRDSGIVTIPSANSRKLYESIMCS